MPFNRTRLNEKDTAKTLIASGMVCIALALSMGVYAGFSSSDVPSALGTVMLNPALAVQEDVLSSVSAPADNPPLDQQPLFQLPASTDDRLPAPPPIKPDAATRLFSPKAPVVLASPKKNMTKIPPVLDVNDDQFTDLDDTAYDATQEKRAVSSGKTNTPKVRVFAVEKYGVPSPSAAIEKNAAASAWRSFPFRSVATRVGRLYTPLTAYAVSSRFGMRHGRLHQGIDMAAPHGTPIKAVADGVVVFSGWYSGYGNLVVVDHGYGLQTRYAHCASRLVTIGRRVRPQEVIATLGNTGHSTGPHLHFEVLAHQVPQDPELYLGGKA